MTKLLPNGTKVSGQRCSNCGGTGSHAKGATCPSCGGLGLWPWVAGP